MFYSPESRGFCSEIVYGSNLPDDAVEISDELYAELMEQLAAGKRIVPGVGGMPCAVDQAEPPEDRRIALERAWRDAELSSSEWLVNRHRDEQDMLLATTLTANQFAELLSHRQALRDWPQSDHFPTTQLRPIAPTWIAMQTM